MEEINWKEEYNVGCDYVDKAHRKLFSVLRKVEALLESKDYEKNRFACVEAIKFLHQYTNTHFAQEEAFMREVGYKGYEMHKKLHDNLKNVTIPALDEDLKDKDYSQEAIQQFIGVFAGWLTGHIMMEDRAITGKSISKWLRTGDRQKEDIITVELAKIMQELSTSQVELVNGHYEGIPIQDAFYYEMSYEDAKIVFIAQNSLVLKLAGNILGAKQVIMNKAALVTYVQLVQSLSKAVMLVQNPNEISVIKKHRAINSDILLGYFKESFPVHSMQWKTDYGYFALCVI